MGVKILVVDDSLIMRKVIERACNICGYDSASIFEASNGKEGLALLEEHAIDLLLVDINMPIMDGVQMLEEVKKRDQNNNIPILIVSAESNKERIEKLSRYGATFIHKPFTPEKLMAEMEKWI
ncbi:response regulator [Fodinibius sp. Rm-B-1B1-1]|uniref:response regulator n=1 Tax=Fodinibius alkaliphilus TaxID=3140241 RepID=UPI00315AE2B9